ncbi:hypothetical protein N7513_004280 [Penicillium frequentans]|nr:hypothetical protein N7513_004280 [Penicillium glabrum]
MPRQSTEGISKSFAKRAQESLLCTVLSDESGIYTSPTSKVTVEKTHLPKLDSPSSHTSRADAPSCGNHVKTSIPFLLSYIDPETSFEDLMKATSARPVGCSQDDNIPPVIPDSQQTLDSGIDLSTWSFLQDLCGLFDFPEKPDPVFESESLWNMHDQQESDTLQVRIDEALQELELYNSSTKPQALNQPCLINPRMRSTPTLSDLDVLVQTYFDYATLHSPIIYRSYLRNNTISSHLLLAVLAAGGQVLPSMDSTFSSSQFFERVQDFVFDQAPLCNPHFCGFNNHPISDEALEILQAALVMLTTEVATKGNVVTHSTCISRFSKLVSAIRGFSLTKVRRYNPFIGDVHDSSTNASATWKQFLRNETMIRIAWMAFLLDVQFVLFFRTPPRFTITEMIGGLPCPDELFTEMPESQVEPELQSRMEALSGSTHDSLSLSALVDLLMQPSLSDNSLLSKVNARGLFCGICGLHSVIFSAQTTHSIPYMRPVIERALDRWQRLWDELQKIADKEQFERLGYMKHALEFWVLAKTLLRADPHVLKIENVDMPSKSHLYAICKQIGNVSLA